MIFKWDDTRPGPQMAAVMVSDSKDPRYPGKRFAIHTTFLTSPVVDIGDLSSLPPSLSPEQAAVIEAALRVHVSASVDYDEAFGQLVAATSALRASLAPRDPVAEVKAAFAEYDEVGAIGSMERLRAAIAALSERGA